MYRGLPLRQGLKSCSGETKKKKKKKVGKKTSLECHTPSDRFLSDSDINGFWTHCFSRTLKKKSFALLADYSISMQSVIGVEQLLEHIVTYASPAIHQMVC
jgi:hypothetical protein